MTREAVLSTIRICKDRDILKTYLESREKEVVDIMITLYSQARAVDEYAEELREEGMEKGREEGREEGLFTAVKSLMETMNLKIDDAFEILKVPAEYRPGIKAMVTT